jgi:hypothetical protein
MSQNATYSATEDPPDHTIIIEANIRASDKEKSVSLDNIWRHRILTSCGDDRVTRGKSHVDPALCMYYGAKFICVMDNTGLRERVPRGNGTCVDSDPSNSSRVQHQSEQNFSTVKKSQL